MYRRAGPIVVLLCTVLAGAGLAGCSVVGYTVGSALDGPESISVSARDLDSTEPGDSIEVVLADSTRLRGTYAALILEDSAVYVSRCLEQFRHAGSDADFPLPGDSLLIVAHDTLVSMRAWGRLLKYDESGLWRIGLGTFGLVRYANIDTLYFGAHSAISGTWLREAAIRREIPLTNDEIALDVSGQTVRVHTGSVVGINLQHKGNARTVGLVIGVVVDVVVVLGTIMTSSTLSFSGRPLK